MWSFRSCDDMMMIWWLMLVQRNADEEGESTGQCCGSRVNLADQLMFMTYHSMTIDSIGHCDDTMIIQWHDMMMKSVHRTQASGSWERAAGDQLTALESAAATDPAQLAPPAAWKRPGSSSQLTYPTPTYKLSLKGHLSTHPPSTCIHLPPAEASPVPALPLLLLLLDARSLLSNWGLGAAQPSGPRNISPLISALNIHIMTNMSWQLQLKQISREYLHNWPHTMCSISYNPTLAIVGGLVANQSTIIKQLLLET